MVLAAAACSSTSRPAATTPRGSARGKRSLASAGPGTLRSPGGWQTIGHSVQGRPLRVLRAGRGPRSVLWIGGIHGDEPQGRVATASLVAAFAAAGLGDRVRLTILEDDNPDGRALNTRDNANHVDLNRNFPARNFDATNPEYGRKPLSQPESRALYDLIQRVGPDLIIVCHAFRGDQLINYDGPGAAIAARFSKLSGLRVEPSSALGEGTPGSLGSLVGIDGGKPILTIEFLRGSDPTADWKKVRPGVMSAIAS